MPVVVTLEANVRPESADDMNSMMKVALPDTRAFAGCQDIRSKYLGLEAINIEVRVCRTGTRGRVTIGTEYDAAVDIGRTVAGICLA